MATFLNTSKINFLLDELIQTAKEELILISPYLKFNYRMQELLHDKGGQQLQVNIIYGKQDLRPNEMKWLAEQKHIKTSFCKNLHAKCYLNENHCIITSMNLYDFSQVNNNEMGVSFSKTQDKLLYNDAYEEAQRLIRISGENKPTTSASEQHQEWNKLTTAKLAEYLGKSSNEIFGLLMKEGYLEMIKGSYELTEKGRKVAGGEKRISRYGGAPYFLWNKPKPKQ
jgi:phosphatidylserine/phosphatidylglycerophosphate/cardiolipin synthase-like enzyme